MFFGFIYDFTPSPDPEAIINHDTTWKILFSRSVPWGMSSFPSAILKEMRYVIQELRRIFMGSEGEETIWFTREIVSWPSVSGRTTEKK